MSRPIKTILLAGTAFMLAVPAHSQSSASMEGRIAALEAMVAQLKAELAAETAQTDSEIIVLRESAQVMPSAPYRPAQAQSQSQSGFMVGDTNIKIGGFVDVDTHVTNMSDGSLGSSSIGRDFYIPSLTQVGGEESTVTDMTAQASRMAISATRGSGADKASAHIEMDFLGSFQGNERVSSSFSPRLRRAYLDYKGWRIGQEWSTFQNTSAIPESASFLALSDGMVFMRQPQIRYSSGNFQLAAENGNATVTASDGKTRIEADSNLIPDFVGRYNFKGDYGNFSLSAIGRQLRYEAGASDESTFGWGVSAAGRIKVGEKDDIRFNVSGGEGMGRYIGLNALNGAAINAKGELEALPSYGGLVAWRHPMGSHNGRFNIGYSALFADNPDFLTTLNPKATKSVQSGYAAYLWDVAPKLTLGVEGLYGMKELDDGSDGNIARLTFSSKYGF